MTTTATTTTDHEVIETMHAEESPGADPGDDSLVGLVIFGEEVLCDVCSGLEWAEDNWTTDGN